LLQNLAYDDEDCSIRLAASYPASDTNQPADASTRGRERSSVAGFGENTPEDDVYYSDDERFSNNNTSSRPIDSNADTSLSPSSNMSVGIEGTLNTLGISLPHSGLSIEEQQIVQQLMVQMVLVNPALASCSPLLVRELALRYLISANLINPAAAQLMKQTLLQTQLLSAVGAASTAVSDGALRKSPEMPAFSAISESPLEELAAGQSFSQRPSFDREVKPDKAPRSLDCRYSSDGSEHRCRSTGTNVDDGSEFDMTMHEFVPVRGRGRSVSSNRHSTDGRDVRPRGRGRSQRPGVQDIDNQLGNIRLSDDGRPGLASRQPSRTMPLHPPAAVQSKMAAASGGKTSLRRDGVAGARVDGEDWDDEVDRYAPKVFAVDSSFYKTSR
jgi:hypothetical protein